MAFPANLTNAIDGVTDVIADHLNHLEAKVGIDGSAVTTSLDYLLKNPASIEPGHKHYRLWQSGGESVGLTVDTSGNVGIGTTAPDEKLSVVGSLKFQDSTGRILDKGGNIIFNILNGYTEVGTGLQVACFRFTTAPSLEGNSLYGSRDASGNLVLDSTSHAAKGYVVLNPTGGNVGIGTTNPNAAALLHLSSSTQGFLPPVMTSTQKTAISSPAAGLVVYDSDLNKLCVYTGSAWETITSG